MSESDSAKVDTEPNVASDVIPSGVKDDGTELSSENTVPKPVDSCSASNQALKQNVLRDCIVHTLHRFTY